MSPITKQEQDIYNCFLKHFRNGLPYQPRKDFSDLSNENIVLLKRLANFFNKFSHIKPDDFFKAPKELHKDEKCPPLKFFTTRPAIRSYSLYMQQLEKQSPEKQIDKIKEGLRFIAKFCVNNNISLEKYLGFKIGCMPVWTQHYREHNINIYCLMELGDNNFKNLQEDEQFYWAPGLIENIDSIRIRYYNSPVLKKFLKEATLRIKKFIDDELQKK